MKRVPGGFQDDKVVDVRDDWADVGWGILTRDREAGTVTVRCKTCGEAATVPDGGRRLEIHVYHKPDCSLFGEEDRGEEAPKAWKRL